VPFENIWQEIKRITEGALYAHGNAQGKFADLLAAPNGKTYNAFNPYFPLRFSVSPSGDGMTG
jgi:hypothetical protein